MNVYSISVGENGERGSSDKTSVGIDEADHRDIARICKNNPKYILAQRILNHTKDAVYSYTELDLLVVELKSLKILMPNNVGLDQILRKVIIAQMFERNIYFWCN